MLRRSALLWSLSRISIVACCGVVSFFDAAHAESSTTGQRTNRRAPESTRGVTTGPSVKADARLFPTKDRFGVKLSLLGDSIAVSTCTGWCKSSEAELRLAIPEEARALSRTTRVLELREGEQALLIEYGDDARRYSFIVVGAPRTADETGEARPSPIAVFRGWSEPHQPRLSIHETKDRTDLYVLGKDDYVCGRAIPDSAQRYDPAQARFVSVKLPPLGASERKNAPALSPTPFQPGEADVLLHLGGERDAGVLTDADRLGAWTDPNGIQLVSAQRLDPKMEWVIQLQRPLDADASFHVASNDRLWTVVLPAQTGTHYTLPIPSDVDCLAIAQGADVVGIVEVMGRLHLDPPPTVAALIAQLDKPDPKWAPAALMLWGEPARNPLTRAYPRLSASGRRSALSVARRSSWGGPILAAAVEVGPQDLSDVASRELLERGAPAADELLSRLGSARADAIPRLSRVAFSLDEQRAARAILAGLGDRRSGEREAYRTVFVRLFSDPEARPVFERALFSEGGFRNLSPIARVNVVRSVADSYDLGSVAPAIVDLARQANFERAYLLTRPLVARIDALDVAPTLESWLGDRSPPDLSFTQRAALVVHLFDQLLEVEPSVEMTAFAEDARRLLDHQNVRVRSSAARFLAKFPLRSARRDLEHALRKDFWPAVRVGAAAALGRLLESAGVELDEESRNAIESLLVRRARRDKDATVRRALVRGLASVGDEQSIAAIRRSLRKDDSYDVRREAALALGRLCDDQSIEVLTDLARQLTQGQVHDEAIALSLAAVSALVRLAPPDLDERLAPLSSDRVPGPVRARLDAQLMAVEASCQEDLATHR